VGVAGIPGVDQDPSHARHDANPYRRSKARGEQLVLEWEGAWTVLRPCVVYGPGDDMLSKLVPLIVQSPVFPAPRGGRSIVQAVHVEDLCEAIRRCLEQPDACHRQSFDVVPRESTTLRELVAHLSSALGLKTWCIPAPGLPQRLAAAAMERTMRDPLITRSQLDLLGRGIGGDPAPLRAALGLELREASPVNFASVLDDSSPPLDSDWSLRLDGGPSARRKRAKLHARLPPVAPTALALVVLHTLFALTIANPWWRVAALDALIVVVGLALLRWPVRELFRDAKPALALLAGTALAALMWVGGAAVESGLRSLAPALAGGVTQVLAWQQLAPLAITLPLIAATVLCEELAFRGALAIPLAHRVGPLRAWILSTLVYAAAHLFVGPPVLALAALAAGTLWTWLAINRGNLLAAFVCHLGWDLLVFWLAPYA
jgi:membrane protease YdiL (CAAX protease family)